MNISSQSMVSKKRLRLFWKKGVCVQQYCSSGITGFMYLAMSCKALTLAMGKGSVAAADRSSVIDKLSAAPAADARLESTLQSLKIVSEKNC
jgi:hypothetical protein